MPTKERVLVVAPHYDDESFGCLGTLLKHKAEGARFSFLWFTYARDAQYGAVEVENYFVEDDAPRVLVDLLDQKLDTYPLVDLIKPIEDIVNKFKPTIAYIPFIGDLNKDHRLVSEAAMVAMRPYKPNAPKVFMYRIPGTTELGLRPFKCDVSIDIDGAKKMELLKEWYPGELINGRHYVEHVEEFERWPR